MSSFEQETPDAVNKNGQKAAQDEKKLLARKTGTPISLPLSIPLGALESTPPAPESRTSCGYRSKLCRNEHLVAMSIGTEIMVRAERAGATRTYARSALKP